MHDSIGSSGGGFKNRRNFKNGKQPITTASRAVRLGLKADTEKPPPPGVPSKRSSKRIPTSLHAMVDGKWKRIAGDISAGGALLLFPKRIEDREVDLMIELADHSAKWEVKGTILRREDRGTRVAHHIRFLDETQVIGLDAAINAAIAAGEERLDTL